MADDSDPWSKRFSNIDKLMAQPATSTAAPAPASTSAPTTSAPPSSDAPPAGGGWGSGVRDIANAAIGGIYDVGATVARNLGMTPNPLPADAQSAMAAHPYVSGAGSLVGGTALAIPLAMGGGELAAGAGVGTGLGGSILTGAGTGAAQNFLTGSPDQPWYERAGVGAALGGGLGALGSKIGGWFGAGRSIDPDVAAAADRLRQAGVTDIKMENLPDIATNVAAQGAAAGKNAAQQYGAGYGRLFGQATPDFSDRTLNTVIPTLGQDVGNAARAGMVNQGSTIPWSGMTVADTLQQVRADAASLTTKPQIERLLNNVESKFGSGGVMSGDDLQELIRNGSPLDLATRNRNSDVSDAANRIEQALRDGFVQSSPPGVGDAYSLAREKYKLALAAEKNVKASGRSYLDPGSLYSTLKGMYPDIARIGSQGSLTDQAVQYARDGDLIFGGGAAAPQQAAPGLLRTLAAGSAGGGAAPIVSDILSGNVNFLNPENYLSPAALGIAAVGGGSALARYLGQVYQRSPGFVNALINAGGAPIGNPLNPYLSTIGTQAFLQRQR